MAYYGHQGGYQQGYGYQTGSHPPPPAGQQFPMAQPSQFYGNYMPQQQQPDVYQQNVQLAFGHLDPSFDIQATYSKYAQSHAPGLPPCLQAEDLRNAMNDCQTIRNYFKINWSLELCKIMLEMLDRSGDGFMQFPEFMELQDCLIMWFQKFCLRDANGTGYIESHELQQMIVFDFHFNLSEAAFKTLLKRYSRVYNGRCLFAFDDFVACSVKLRAFTDAFRKRDQRDHGGQETGATTFSYDDFIQCVMCL